MKIKEEPSSIEISKLLSSAEKKKSSLDSSQFLSSDDQSPKHGEQLPQQQVKHLPANIEMKNDEITPHKNSNKFSKFTQLKKNGRSSSIVPETPGVINYHSKFMEE